MECCARAHAAPDAAAGGGVGFPGRAPWTRRQLRSKIGAAKAGGGEPRGVTALRNVRCPECPEPDRRAREHMPRRWRALWMHSVLVTLSLAASRPAHAAGVNFAWNDCGNAGTYVRQFACNT